MKAFLVFIGCVLMFPFLSLILRLIPERFWKTLLSIFWILLLGSCGIVFGEPFLKAWLAAPDLTAPAAYTPEFGFGPGIAETCWNFALMPPIQGQVVNQRGEPVADVKLTVQSINADDWPCAEENSSITTRTDMNGYFRFKERWIFEWSELVLTAEHADYALYYEKDFDSYAVFCQDDDENCQLENITPDDTVDLKIELQPKPFLSTRILFRAVWLGFLTFIILLIISRTKLRITDD